MTEYLTLDVKWGFTLIEQEAGHANGNCAGDRAAGQGMLGGVLGKGKR